MLSVPLADFAGGAVAGLEAEMTKLMQEAGLVAPDQKPGKGSALVTNPDGTYSLGEAGQVQSLLTIVQSSCQCYRRSCGT